MKRTIIKIDEELCNGCEACVHGCHEGALQMIDGKARMVSELYCDGLGACVGDCPVGAITLEEREAIPYDEIATIQRMIPKGEKTILAHLKHLKDHEEFEYLKQAVGYLKANNVSVDFAQVHIASASHRNDKHHEHHQQVNSGGCPGSRSISFKPEKSALAKGLRMANQQEAHEMVSQLRQWPVQLHLLNPQAGYFKNADVVLAADCVPFSFSNFHDKFLAGKTLAIACPKLDTNKEAYVEKIKTMIIDSGINTLQVVIMEVPCCGSLLSIANKAIIESGRKIPVKLSVVGIRGDIISEDWV